MSQISPAKAPAWHQHSPEELTGHLEAAVEVAKRLASRVHRGTHLGSRSVALLHALGLASSRRDSIASVVERDLDRYDLLLAGALDELRFSEAEARVIVDTLHGTLITGLIDAQTLGMDVEESIEVGMVSTWGLDEAGCVELVTKLRALDTLQGMAVIDATERFWAQPHEGYRDRLIAVGLLRAE